MSILKDQLTALRSKSSTLTAETPTSNASSSSSLPNTPSSVEENLLNTAPPLDLQDLSVPDKFSVTTHYRPPSASLSSTSGHSVSLQRAVFHTNKINPAHSTPTPVSRSGTLPTFSASRNTVRALIPRPNLTSPSTSAISIVGAVPMTATKSRGVQMVSEMRARVKNLEQKIHTRVPRLRMGSNAGRQGSNIPALSTTASASPSAIPRSTLESKLNKSTPQRFSADKNGATTPDPNTSGWVLIMDDTPSPSKDPEKDRRRVSSPSAPSAYRRGTPKASSPTFSKPNPLGQSTVRRPQSRLSGASMSTTATVSSIPTPSSRPATPTSLPLSISSLYSTSYASGIGKCSAGAGLKRASLGSNSTESPTPLSDTEIIPRDRPVSYNAKIDRPNDARSTSQLPHSHANVTFRGSSRIPSSANSSSVLAQSRIGRPAGLTSGRKSAGIDPSSEDCGGFLAPSGVKKIRGRSGSNTTGSARQ